MAKLVSRFAIGALATLDNDNPRVELVGNRPWAGVLFKVNWPQLVSEWMNISAWSSLTNYSLQYLILGGICTVQIVLGFIAVLWSNTVFVKDDSYLSTARLLRRKFHYILFYHINFRSFKTNSLHTSPRRTSRRLWMCSHRQRNRSNT